MKKSIITIEGMQKSYALGGEVVQALKDVTLTIYEGDFISIIGPSGSGKSTFMNMIGCLDRPDSGTYVLDGLEVGRMNDDQLAQIRNERIGFIFQSFHLLPRLTACENVELPLIYRGWGAKQRNQQAHLSLDQVGLSDRANYLPAQLSGGQQQRVAIARALTGHPSILLADEPTGALDSQTSKEILRVIKKLNQNGHTIILITHDLEVAQQANRIVQIRDGRLYENGGVELGIHAVGQHGAPQH